MNTFQAAVKQLVKQSSMTIVASAMWASAPAIAFAQGITEIDPQYSNYYGTLTASGMGDFMVDWSVSIVSGFYKNYP